MVIIDALTQRMTKSNPADRCTASDAYMDARKLVNSLSMAQLSQRACPMVNVFGDPIEPETPLMQTVNDLAYRIQDFWWTHLPSTPLPPFIAPDTNVYVDDQKSEESLAHCLTIPSCFR